MSKLHVQPIKFEIKRVAPFCPPPGKGGSPNPLKGHLWNSASILPWGHVCMCSLPDRKPQVGD